MKILEFRGYSKDLDSDRPADPNVTVFLHGFPGVRSKQNRDLAERAAIETGGLCLAPLYLGLGHSEGEFSFSTCREEVREFVEGVLARYGPIDLVGHSWGGFLGLYLAADHGEKIRNLLLMSPLLSFHNPHLAERSFQEAALGNPQLNLAPAATLADDFVKVGTEMPARELAARISEKTGVSILQAADDDITPGDYALKILPKFKSRPAYKTIETDHSFLRGRDQAIGEIVRELKTLKQTRGLI